MTVGVDLKDILEKIKRCEVKPEDGLRLFKTYSKQPDSKDTPPDNRFGSVYYTSGWIKKMNRSDKEISGENLLIICSEGLLLRFLNRHFQDSCNLTLAIPADDFGRTQEGAYQLDLNNPEHYKRIFKELAERGQSPAAVVYIPDTQSDISADNIKTSVKKTFSPLFLVMQQILAHSQGTKIRVLNIFSTGVNARWITEKAISGFARTIQLENPNVYLGNIELKENILLTDESRFIELAEIIQAELADGLEFEIYYDHGDRYVKSLIKDNGDAQFSDIPPYKPGAVYLITGGLGGLGILIARHLAENYKARLILTGRSELNAEKVRELENLNSLGADAVYIRSDITNEDEVKRLIRQIKAEYKKIDGVFHGAGLYKNGFILKKSLSDVEAVIAPKVYGTIYLDEALGDEALDFFVLFSSLAGVIGKIGQSDYAFANCFEDYFAQIRSGFVANGKRNGKTVSLNWPYWQEGVMQILEEEKEHFSLIAGIEPLPTADGLKAIEFGIHSENHNYTVLYGDKEKIEAYMDKTMISDQSEDTEYIRIDESTLYDKTENLLKEIIADEVGLLPDQVNAGVRFEDYGIDSIVINHFNAEIEKKLGPLPKTLLFEYQTVNDLVAFMVSNYQKQLMLYFKINSTKIAESNKKHSDKSMHEPVGHGTAKQITGAAKLQVNEDIAIIGMSGRYPGASNIDEFWNVLKDGKDCITEIPEDRWNANEYFDENADMAKHGKMYCKWGGFLEDIYAFDPLFFNISPIEAETMDPQERILLQAVWEAMEDSGYTPQSLREHILKKCGGNVGVFIGATSFTYNLLGPEEWIKGNMTIPISAPWSIANKISYVFNFSGPSLPVDTACSSGLIAIHLACESLRKGECATALVGGVNLYLHPSKYIGMCQMKMLSSKGRCFSFADKADGFVPGEGAGVFLLKPLSQAEKDKDNIYAVIKASAVNHGGRTHGFTVPNPNAQSDLIADALTASNINPRTISYIECHGTGTALGDPIEITGLTKAYSRWTNDKQFCAIGTVKTNIGHLESCAGIAGLTKIILQLKHKQLVPSLHCENFNPNIDFEASPVLVQTALSDWKRPVLKEGGLEKEYPRRAGISSFGAGGANAHIIIEEYEKPDTSYSTDDEGPQICVLSAMNMARLSEYAYRIADYLDHKRLSPEKLPSLLEATLHQLADPAKQQSLIQASEIERYQQAFVQLNVYSNLLLINAFREMGVFKGQDECYSMAQLKAAIGLIKEYERLFDVLIDIFEKGGFIEREGDTIVTTKGVYTLDINDAKQQLSAQKMLIKNHYPEMEPFLSLVHACVQSYPDVLTGHLNHTDVMFPGGSMELVENIYKGNKIVDYFNKMLALTVRRYIMLRLEINPAEKIQILEVGAGTGGTSAFVLEELLSYKENIQYFYTDISLGFTQSGKKAFGAKYPFVEFKVLDVEKLPAKQGFVPKSMDIVFASNVIHATKKIDTTLTNVKSLIKDNGMFILNESIQRLDYSSLTFGLTTGWWLFGDDDCRIRYSPLLNVEKWKEVLKNKGFYKIDTLSLPGEKNKSIYQNLIICENKEPSSENGINGKIDLSFGSIAYTLQNHREPMKERLALVVSSAEELVEKLYLFAQGKKNVSNIYVSNTKNGSEISELLHYGRAGKEFINIIRQDKDYKSLAKLWIMGVDVNWKTLWGDNPPERIFLPTYPFAKEKYLIQKSKKVIRVLDDEYEQAVKLHPLIDENISSLDGLLFNKNLKPNDKLLTQIMIRQKGIFPPAVLLEMACVCAKLANTKQKVSTLKNIQWGKPLLETGVSTQLLTYLYPNERQVDFEIASVQDGISEEIHIQGELYYEADSSQKKVNSSWDLNELKSSLIHFSEGSDVYEYLEHRSLTYGSDWRAVAEVYSLDNTVLAQIDLPDSPFVVHGLTLLHPALLEGIFQTISYMMGLSKDHDHEIYLPYCIKALMIDKPVTGSCFAYIKKKDLDGRGHTFDISILDDQGLSIANIMGFSIMLV
jgi:acyl transferase domain-containing protein/ubiquinone/menaquinone biosynthesis C-methylase UbiE/acyl carrier protein